MIAKIPPRKHRKSFDPQSRIFGNEAKSRLSDLRKYISGNVQHRLKERKASRGTPSSL